MTQMKRKLTGITFEGKPLEYHLDDLKSSEISKEMQGQQKLPIYRKPLGKVKPKVLRPGRVKIIYNKEDQMQKAMVKSALEEVLHFMWQTTPRTWDRYELQEKFPNINKGTISGILSVASRVPSVETDVSTQPWKYKYVGKDTFDKFIEEYREETRKPKILDPNKKRRKTTGTQVKINPTLPSLHAVIENEKVLRPKMPKEGDLAVQQFISMFEALGYEVEITIKRKKE